LQFFNTLGSIVQIAGLWKLALEAQEWQAEFLFFSLLKEG
jgi:hypothetical protein